MKEKENINIENIESKNLSKSSENFEDSSQKIEKIKTKEVISGYLESLQELVKKGIISQKSADKIISENVIPKEEIEKMFDKINEIESIKDIDKYFPSNLRITKNEYIEALENKISRIHTITKLNIALNFLSEQIPGNTSGALSVFKEFLTVLDKNLF